MKNVTFKTRLAKGGDVVITNAAIDFTDVTTEQMEELATRSIVIASQAVYRTAGIVPAHDTIKVSDMLKRERGGFKHTPQSVAAMVLKMSPDERAFIEQSLRDAKKLIKAA